MKYWFFAFVFLATLGSLIALLTPDEISVKHEDPAQEMELVKSRVMDFAATFKMVSLLATSTLGADFEQYYGPFISAELLTQWRRDPSLAPGRLTSSPYPDHAQIDSIEKQQDGTYRVIANIVELTTATTTPAALTPIYMRLQNIDGIWKIVELQKNPYTED